MLYVYVGLCRRDVLMNMLEAAFDSQLDATLCDAVHLGGITDL